jgi:hypothetical protein
VQECRQTQSEFCRSLVSSSVDPRAGNDCLATVANAYRDADLRGDELAVVLRLGGPCAGVAKGASRAGEACNEASDCDLGRSYDCVRKADGTGGTCQIPQVSEPGRDCHAVQETCSEGFFCDGENCIETLAAGDPCTIHEQCGADGYCDDSGQCAARKDVNDTCQDDIECARGVCSEFGDSHVCTDRVVLSRADPLCANLR